MAVSCRDPYVYGKVVPTLNIMIQCGISFWCTSTTVLTFIAASWGAIYPDPQTFTESVVFAGALFRSLGAATDGVVDLQHTVPLVCGFGPRRCGLG